MLRHQRTLELADFDSESLCRIQDSRVLVVGAGGLGSVVLPLLAAQEVGEICVVDSDCVEESNLPRQTLYTEQDIGCAKAELAALRLRALNPRGRVDGNVVRVDAGWLASRQSLPDLVIDCTDNFATRGLLDSYCGAHSFPLVWGAVEGYTGQLSLLHGKRQISLRDIFGELPASRPLSNGVFAPLVHMVGAMMSSIALRWLAFGASELDGRLWQCDARSGATQIFEL